MSDEPGFAGSSSTAAAGLASSSSTDVEEQSSWRARQLAADSHRNGYMDDLIRSLDLLTFAEIATVYFLDNSFLLLIVRSGLQYLHLTPRERAFPELEHWPYVNAILLVNSLCVVTHLLFGAPSAGEATRGYMHGGLLLDFVGQLGPTSKIRLFLLDLMILALQFAMMAATTKRKRMGQGRNENSAAGLSLLTEPASAGQDLDAEERGLSRRDSWSPTERLIEPESLYLLQPTSTTDDNPSRTDLFALSDSLYSGQENIAQLWIWDAMREQFRLVRAEALSPTSSLSNLLRNDMRRRAYELSIPFRS